MIVVFWRVFLCHVKTLHHSICSLLVDTAHEFLSMAVTGRNSHEETIGKTDQFRR